MRRVKLPETQTCVQANTRTESPPRHTHTSTYIYIYIYIFIYIYIYVCTYVTHYVHIHMSAALLHGPLQVCTANHLTSMLRKELVRNSSEVEETLVPPSPCLKGVLLRLFLDCSLTAQQHKSYLLSPVKFFSPEHTCRSYDEASCSSGNTSGMQREATHVQSMCQAGAKSAPLDITHSKHVALTICAHHVHMVSRSFVLF